MSGGPILNNDGKVVGINIIGTSNYGIGMDMGYIVSEYSEKAQVFDHLPPANEVFNCSP